ncbi:stage II sporulation protein M [Myroides sp. LJL115]
MREVSFIKKNREQWQKYEDMLKSYSPLSADDLSSMYISLLNDLGYAQTFYPHSKVTQYLNALCAQTYQKIYKRKRAKHNVIEHFFLQEVPLLLYQYRSYLFFSLALFLATVFIGVISSYYDPSFVRLVLGDEYVNRTLENIASDDPMAIYKSGGTWSSFTIIAANNLYVGVRFFLYGIFAGGGTLLFLLHNGIMIGSFQYFFIAQNSFWESFKGIWLHGFLEVISMVIEACAGFIVGGSILFPKTYSRVQSFQIGFKNALKIFLATVPFTIVAAFIEGFITRYSKEMPNILNYSILLLTFTSIVYYFFIFPYKAKKRQQQPLKVY